MSKHYIVEKIGPHNQREAIAFRSASDAARVFEAALEAYAAGLASGDVTLRLIIR